MEPRILQLNDRAVFEGYFRLFPPQTSELTFSNLFIWGGTYHWLWREDNGVLSIVARPPQGEPYLLPLTGDSKEYAGTLNYWRKYFYERNWLFAMERIPAMQVQVLRDLGEKPKVYPQPEHDDYVYQSKELIRLEGRRFSRKRNHLKRTANYSWQYRTMVPDDVEDCLRMAEAWCRMRACDEDPGFKGEMEAVGLALKYLKNLSMRGGVIRVENEVVAFALGEPLNVNTAVIHIEKAHHELEGVYPLINREFAQEWHAMTYINREQDLGIEGLRRAKESYYPHHMVEKFRLVWE